LAVRVNRSTVSARAAKGIAEAERRSSAATVALMAVVLSSWDWTPVGVMVCRVSLDVKDAFTTVQPGK
jgi:hypothetical protein